MYPSSFKMVATSWIDMSAPVPRQSAISSLKPKRWTDPASCFIDEIDGIGAKRTSGGDGNQEANRTLIALLNEMDGFHKHPHPIVVIAATNRDKELDPALLRRFGRKAKFKLPKYADVLRIFQHYAATVTMAADVDLAACAKKAVGLPGSAIENIVNEAALKLLDGDDEDVFEIPQELLMAAVDEEVHQQVSTSAAKRVNPEENKTKMSDVIGGPREDVSDIIAFLKDPSQVQSSRHQYV